MCSHKCFGQKWLVNLNVTSKRSPLWTIVTRKTNNRPQHISRPTNQNWKRTAMNQSELYRFSRAWKLVTCVNAGKHAHVPTAEKHTAGAKHEKHATPARREKTSGRWDTISLAFASQWLKKVVSSCCLENMARVCQLQHSVYRHSNPVEIW